MLLLITLCSSHSCIPSVSRTCHALNWQSRTCRNNDSSNQHTNTQAGACMLLPLHAHRAVPLSQSYIYCSNFDFASCSSSSSHHPRDIIHINSSLTSPCCIPSPTTLSFIVAIIAIIVTHHTMHCPSCRHHPACSDFFPYHRRRVSKSAASSFISIPSHLASSSRLVMLLPLVYLLLLTPSYQPLLITIDRPGTSQAVSSSNASINKVLKVCYTSSHCH